MAPTTTPVVPGTTPLQEEASFIEQFSAKLEAGEVGVDRGRAKVERESAEPAKPAATEKGKTTSKAADDTDDTDTPAKAGTPGGSDESPDDDDDDDDETDTGGDASAVDDAAAKPDDDDEGGTDDDDDDEVIDDDDDEPEEGELAKEARAELAKHGLNVKLEDLPKEARALVKTTLDNMKAGFTRAMMEQRAYRKEEAALRGELQFFQTKPALAIVDLIHKHPEIEDEINALLTEAATETGKKALEITTRDSRAEVLKSITDQSAATERVLQRADEIETYTREACIKLNLPFDIVVEAVVNKLHEKDPAARDLSNEEIDAIIGRQRNILRRHTGERNLDRRKNEIQGRNRDRKTVSPAARATPGVAAGGPAGKKMPTTDAEFVERMAEKLGSGKR